MTITDKHASCTDCTNMNPRRLGGATLKTKHRSFIELPKAGCLSDSMCCLPSLQERAENRPISPLMDRFKTGPMVGQNQLGFYSVITFPLYRVWWQLFPSAGEALYDQLHRNYEFFQGNQGQLTLAAVESALTKELSSAVSLPGTLDTSPSSISAKGGQAHTKRDGASKRGFWTSNSEKASLIRVQSVSEEGKGG